ncbi:unnamed protein product [Lepeophtheirus salmonis]|uniref:(salmon louse) hypothetical protein n=1 Tax=Lepeophtheirus salmonis TaxID=72036 RepID=A0A7R8D246_LEPSM|nr:unnamed protein product [Lepeophtheirus salmonis]CAF3002132.1 unnamed protein product [Lepeophtheirus salmonis]
MALRYENCAVWLMKLQLQTTSLCQSHGCLQKLPGKVGLLPSGNVMRAKLSLRDPETSSLNPIGKKGEILVGSIVYHAEGSTVTLFRVVNDFGNSIPPYLIFPTYPQMVAYTFPNAFTPANIVAGIRSTSIYPMDRHIFPDPNFKKPTTCSPTAGSPLDKRTINVKHFHITKEIRPFTKASGLYSNSNDDNDTNNTMDRILALQTEEDDELNVIQNDLDDDMVALQPCLSDLDVETIGVDDFIFL